MAEQDIFGDIEEEQKRKKRELEMMWKKLLAYYMMDAYVSKAEAKSEMEFRSAFNTTSLYVKKHGLLNRLFEKRENAPSAAELLKEIGSLETPETPLGELLAELQKDDSSEEKLLNALTRVIVEEPPRMIEGAQYEQQRRADWKSAHSVEIKQAGDFELVDAEEARYEERLGKKMLILRAVMPHELYKELEQCLASDERMIRADQVGKQDQQSQKGDYESYIRAKRVEPEEKAGKLANSGDIYSAAAYMLAAWEQKDSSDFDEEKADARAMELSGSRAFKAYMKGHPGNLLAAARGTAVEEAHNGVTALNADLNRRDAILMNTRDSLKRMATGKTPRFHHMLNALDRFVNADTEPSQKEKSSLVSALGEYIVNECGTGSREYDKSCFIEAMRSIKALLTETDFEKVVDRVNADRASKVKVSDFDMADNPKLCEREKAKQKTLHGSKP